MNEPTSVASVDNDDRCFCCGKQNERGLHLVFSYPEPGHAEAELSIPEWFSGWRSMTHGGLLSTLLDEVMAHACISTEGYAITAEMTIRFRRPVSVGTRVRISAEVSAVRSRLVETVGVIEDAEGNRVAEASGKFLKVSAEEAKAAR